MTKKRPPKQTTKSTPGTNARTTGSNYPRHSLEAALRIPKAILDQNAGKPTTDKQASQFVGLKSPRGPFAVEIGSGIKYGYLKRPSTGTLEVTDLARQILRPKAAEDATKGYQQAVLNAPTLSDVYLHYRGENLPDREFFDNALEDTFKIPKDKLSEFKDVFTQSLKAAKLSEELDGRVRILHSATESQPLVDGDERIQKISASAGVKSSDTCLGEIGVRELFH